MRTAPAFAVVLLALFSLSAPVQAEQEQYKKFEKLLTGAKLAGKFTVVGRPQNGPLPEEFYMIESVRKLPEGDKWLIRARIKYGNTDVTIPLPLDVRFVDDTPMITLTNAKIPLMGEFSARVIFYNGKYAGTWTHHGKGGGHLFGTIERMEKNIAPKKNDSPDKKDSSDDNSAGK
ncbi:MAG: hypothetical protein VB878_11235 [Pirellulaceae bacterium]